MKRTANIKTNATVFLVSFFCHSVEENEAVVENTITGIDF